MIDILLWSSHVMRIYKRVVKKIFVREFIGARIVGRSRKRWIDAIGECVAERKSMPEVERMVYELD